MHQILRTRKFTAYIFYVFIIFFSTINLFFSILPVTITIAEEFGEKETSLKEKIINIEGSMNDNIIMKNGFIEFYGFVQRILYKKEYGNFEIAKDFDGKLHYVYFATESNPVTGIGSRTVALEKLVEESGGQMLYVMPPDKIVEGVTEFPIGMPHPYDNETATNFLEHIGVEGVDYLDLREEISNSGIESDEYFYDTDHHWTIPTAFWAFTQIVDFMEEEYGENLDPDGFYRNIDHYNQIVYPESFLGSMGRQAGIIYSGIDDFVLVYPKFSTEFTFMANNNDSTITFPIGEFENTLIQASKFTGEQDIMSIESDKYFAYLAGNYPYVEIDNLKNYNGIRVLFIKDSYFVPVAAFFANVCSEVDLIDPRFYDGDIEEKIRKEHYDYVVVGYSAPNLTYEFFPFGRTQ
ncbi:MAG: DHHW family protein [Eubacteriales bacterium]